MAFLWDLVRSSCDFRVSPRTSAALVFCLARRYNIQFRKLCDVWVMWIKLHVGPFVKIGVGQADNPQARVKDAITFAISLMGVDLDFYPEPD